MVRYLNSRPTTSFNRHFLRQSFQKRHFICRSRVHKIEIRVPEFDPTNRCPMKHVLFYVHGNRDYSIA
ncbi:hypothetical protein HanRHA438_Chr13g0629411 [Helianthus annuus]|nr:hypothetical protein HanRHA438_Chr13g0629411 [Helianthus annuus]